MRKFANAVSWFEIPVKDFSRAVTFYEMIFETTLQVFPVNEVLKMALLPAEEGTVGGALVQHPHFYRPSHDGTVVYLNANPDIQPVLDRLEKNGGKIIIPKRQISPDRGYMAVFEDCEGNRVALHSDK